MIESFTANPNCVQLCQEVFLTWIVSNANTVTISPGIGSVSNTGSYKVTPGSTTTYTLSATNSAGSVSASTTVAVAPQVSTLGTSYGTQVSSGVNVASADTNGILTMGVGGNNNPLNSGPLLVFLIGLLAVATAVIVVIARKPAMAYAGHRGSKRTGYLSSATSTMDATEIPGTSPVGAGVAAKFVAPGGEQIPISGNGGTLGRDNLRSFVIPGKASLISREHIGVYCKNGEYYIEDLNSTNGTMINGSKLSGKDRLLLKDGDEITLADALTLIFKA